MQYGIASTTAETKPGAILKYETYSYNCARYVVSDLNLYHIKIRAYLA